MARALSELRKNCAESRRIAAAHESHFIPPIVFGGLKSGGVSGTDSPSRLVKPAARYPA